MTYADTITLLLCFFVVFVIVSSVKKEPRQDTPMPQMQAVTAQIRPSVQPPQREAATPRPSVGSPPLSHGRLPARDTDTGNARTKAAVGVDEPSPRAKDAAGAGVAPLKTDGAVRRPLAVIPPPELVAGAKSPDATASEPKGDRITTLEMGSAAFFDSGSATLNDSGKAILRGILARLTAALAAGYRIKVEGHTDDTPIDTAQFPSNWELSTARASAVVHFFLEQGIPAQRLRAIGYADTEPKAPNRDAAGDAIPQNQAQNRRVVIKLEKIETARR